MTPRTLYFYLRLPPKELQALVDKHQEEFEILIGDTFNEDELQKHEALLDSLSTIEVQPILSELSFFDFYPSPSEEEKQQDFFHKCHSSICLENVPYFDNNPFQVTYLIDLLWMLDEVLIDQGGVSELMFKRSYIDLLKKYKGMDSLISQVVNRPVEIKTVHPVSPIDFLILDIYRELDRLTLEGKAILLTDQSDKFQKIYSVMSNEKLDADSLLKKSGLVPKDFGDNLERLKFFLRKI